jgi:hypothetical protein
MGRYRNNVEIGMLSQQRVTERGRLSRLVHGESGNVSLTRPGICASIDTSPTTSIQGCSESVAKSVSRMSFGRLASRTRITLFTIPAPKNSPKD